ncbi:MAG: hypothetical protein OHK0046_44600 [Anaerolineae bacterium]
MRVFFLLTVLLFGVVAAVLLPRDPSPHEASLLWIIHDDASTNAAPADALRAVRSNLRDLFARWEGEPPLYILMLDAWVMLTGETVVAVRWFSLLCAVVAAALLYRESLLYLWVVLIALVYAGTRIEPFALLALWSALATRALDRPPSWFWDGFYAALLMAALYTHPGGIVLVVLHILWRTRYRRVIVGTVAALLLVLPWVMMRGIDLSTSNTLWIAAVMAALPVISLPHLRFLRPEVRYGLAVAGTLAAVAFSVWMPPYTWQTTIAEVQAQRQPTQPIILGYTDQHPLAYFDRLGMGLQRGLTVNTAWREQTPEAVETLLNAVAAAPEIWVIITADEPQTALLSRLELSHNPDLTLTNRDVAAVRYVEKP